VGVQYTVFRNDGASWFSTQRRFTIAQGAPGIWVNGLTDNLSGRRFRSGYTGFQVMITMVWRTQSGTYLGAQELSYDRVGDYRCAGSTATGAFTFCIPSDFIWFI
jgi:hypothetical protein